MGPKYDDREPQPELSSTREPLVDIPVTPAQPNESQPGSRPRRKRLSDIETEGGQAQPQPPSKPCRRSLAADETGSNEPPFEPQARSEPHRPRRVDIVPAPQGQAQAPRAGRARGAITHPCDDLPGLQNIIDPPHLSNDTPVPAQSKEAAQPRSPVDPAQIEQLVAELRTKQNLSIALAGGLAAAVIGAMVWALVTVATNYQIGWMAVGVGFLVGGAVRTLGRGIDKSFGYLGAAMSVFGCLLGNLLSLCAVVAGREGLSPLAVLAHVCGNPVVIPAAMIATFHPMDLLFYGLAVYEGYRFSFRQVTDAEIGRAVGRHSSLKKPDVC
jgi:hypothetical protein